MIAIFKKVPNGVVVKDGMAEDAQAYPEIPRTKYPAVESAKAFDYLTEVDAQISDQIEIFKAKLHALILDFMRSQQALSPVITLGVGELISGVIAEEFALGGDVQSRLEFAADQTKLAGVFDLLTEEGIAKLVRPEIARLLTLAQSFGAPADVLNAISKLDDPVQLPTTAQEERDFRNDLGEELEHDLEEATR